MPFYKIAEMQQSPSTANPQQFVQTAVGEFMKAGIVTKPDEEGPPLHMHPNEEQFTLVLEGKLHFVLGDEERICERGDLDEDYNKAEGAEEAERRFAEAKRKTS